MKQDQTQVRLSQKFNLLEPPFRPDVRWWLAEGLNTDKTLEKNIQQIHDLGFGAAEFLAMPEPGADSAIYGWGSQEWTADTQRIIREATRLGLGFSLTSGAHWATANLPDTFSWQGEPYTPDSKACAKELDYATVLLEPGQSFDGKLPLCPAIQAVQGDAHGAKTAYSRYEFQGVTAARILKGRPGAGQAFGYAEGAGTGVLDPDSLTDLTAQARQKDGAWQLSWTAPQDGPYALFVYWMHGTGQIASPSVSTNYTINYMDPYGVEALIDYWEQVVLTDEMKTIIRENGRGEIYMDSLEMLTFGAGGLLWGYTLKDEFLRRKGYDLTRYLPLVCADRARVESNGMRQYDYDVPSSAQADLCQKVRTDYFSVISALYVENTLKPLQKWLHTLGMKLRAEPSYGANFEISTPARYLDGVETESFAQTADVDLYRGMLGSANVCGRPFSSETGAVFGHNYYYNMDTWTQLCYLQFVMGVVRTVFHGYSGIEGSEADTFWPGHEGMYAKFSERFGGRQPASAHYRDWTDALARCQKMLRQGAPRRDLAIWRTDYLYVNYGKPKGYDTFESNFMMHDKAYFWQDLALQHAGYTYDYFSPLLLEDGDVQNCGGGVFLPDGPAYQAIIVYQQQMEVQSAQKLLEIAKAGLPVLFVNHTREIICHGEGGEIAHGIAASQSPWLCQSDQDVRVLTQQIKALPNVREIDGAQNAKQALEQMGVLPRTAFDAPNSRVLTCSRYDAAENLFYTFAYCYKFKMEQTAPACAFELRLKGLGQPYQIDEWTGKVTQLGLYRQENGYTCVPLTLSAGQAALIALDLGAEKSVHAVRADAPAVRHADGLYLRTQRAGVVHARLSSGQEIEAAAELPRTVAIPRWDIRIEDWDEGEKHINTEEKFGHITTEVYYDTKKTALHFPDSPLMAWKDLPASPDQLALLSGDAPSMAQVSGLASYRCTVTLSDRWQDCGAALIMENAGGGTVSVWINGCKAPGVHTRTLRVDVSGLLKPGENQIEIQVASTLTNRMLARGYQQKNSGWTDSFPTVQAYGLTGTVRLVPYRDVRVAP